MRFCWSSMCFLAKSTSCFAGYSGIVHKTSTPAELNCSSFLPSTSALTVFKHYALASTFRTDDAYHRPPRGVVMPRAFKASAI